MSRMEPSTDPVRVDRWLWAARLVKTRGLAAEAVRAGRVQINGRRVKPSHDVRPGDSLAITLGEARIGVIVRATATRRGPAEAAAVLYDETAESREVRERRAAERRVEGQWNVRGGPRPTKRDRRRFEARSDTRSGRRPAS
jgi:ribosome-associated heat shock protein Hsp15